MSLISTQHLRLVPQFRTALWTLWTDHRQRRAARAALERLVAKNDDHLLDDIGIDRATAYELLDETLVVPHRAWDRWQI